VHGNALRLNWEEIISKNQLDYILGNPPFIGYAWQSKEQKEDLGRVFENRDGTGVLDYVTAWYKKAAEYIQGTKIKVAFVSTNSIIQGEQSTILWSCLSEYDITLFFAHRTFKWNNEAKGNAAVHVVIVGFANYDVPEKYIYEYQHIKAEPLRLKAKRINNYLIDAENIFIQKRTSPISNVPSISRGSDAIDDGNFLLDQTEKDELLNAFPESKKYIKPFLMGKEFINNIPRYCIWLKNADLAEVRRITPIYEKIEKVKRFREASKRVQTLKAAKFPYLFGEERQPTTDYLAIPKVSSEAREYIPIGFCHKDIICGDKLFYMPSASHYHFGVLTSLMHMTWMRYVCGRLKSDYSYSNTIVYNNFPWPQDLATQKIKGVEKLAQQVLKVRERYPESSLADLYDPLTMPADLVRAHQDLDKFVDTCYRPQPFETEMQRIEFLFDLYKKYTQPLFGSEKKKKK
jgi:hypothetical protein